MNRKTLLRISAAGFLTLGIGFAGWYLQRARIIDWTSLFTSAPAEEGEASDETPGSQPPGTDNPGNPGDTKTGDSDKPKETGDKETEEGYYEPIDPADSGRVETVSSTETGSIEPTEEQRGTGIIGITKVQLSPEGEKLLREGPKPELGDHIRVQVAADKIYELKVLDITEVVPGSIGMQVEVIGVPLATAMLQYCEGRIFATIKDPAAHRIYTLVYNLNENTYTVIVHDTAKLPIYLPPESIERTEQAPAR